MTIITPHWRLKASRGYFLVSDRDIEQVITRKWSSHNAGAVVASVNGKLTLLHRFLMNPPAFVGATIKMVVDHINGDRSDNRRENLRVVTYKENAMNVHATTKRGKFKGVWFHTKNGHGWVAECRGKHLGVFNTAIEAAMRYDQEIMKQIGPSGRFNFPCAFLGER